MFNENKVLCSLNLLIDFCHDFIIFLFFSPSITYKILKHCFYSFFFMICCWDHGSYLFKQSACKLKKAFIKTIKRCIGKEMWLRWKNIFKVDYLIEEKINYIYKKSCLTWLGHWFQLP